MLLLGCGGLRVLLTHLSARVQLARSHPHRFLLTKLVTITLFGTYLTLRLDAALTRRTIAGCILLEVPQFLHLLLRTLTCFLS